MNRIEAMDYVKSKLKNKNLIKHSLAVEACMRRLARRFMQNEEMWGLAGLLHDLDYEDTKDDFSRHGFVTAEILQREGVDSRVIEAIKAHPGHVERTTPMAKALYSVDPLTGLIVAACLMHPDKKLKALDTEFILNRFKEKSFARGANRLQIESCTQLRLSLDNFVTMCLESMKEISEDLEL